MSLSGHKRLREKKRRFHMEVRKMRKKGKIQLKMKLNTTKKVLEKIRHERQRAGLTQAQLAEAIGVTRITISHIETGKFELKISMLEKICDALGVEMCIFLDRK